MKKIVFSVGFVALGLTGAKAVDTALMSQGAAKPWAVSAALRGFYDDNSATQSGGEKSGSYGYTVSPGAKYAWSSGPTSLKLDYLYSYIYFDKRVGGRLDKADQDHSFNASFEHAFSERYQVSVLDNFVVGQEPDTLRTGSALGTTQRLPGDNIRNTGSISFNAQMTPVLSLLSGYQNSLSDYAASGAAVSSGPTSTNIFPSPAGTLNRLENSLHLDARWQVQPETTALVGYQYSMANFTGDEKIGILQPSNIVLMSDSRNNRANYGYVGAEHRFTPDLQVGVRGGLRSTDYYNDPSHSTDLSPYANANISYTFSPDTSLQVGFNYDRNATDRVDPSQLNNSFVRDQQSATVFGTVKHRLVSRLYGSVTGQFQDSKFVGGALDSQTENIYLIGLNLEYRFNPNFSANAGYDYDKVDTQIQGASYDRNRVYLGLTASY